MAYNDALFQLGMDLTRSSTAQKEDHGNAAHVAVAHNKSSSERFGDRFGGGTDSPSVSNGAILLAIMPPKRNRPSIRAERVKAA